MGYVFPTYAHTHENPKIMNTQKSIMCIDILISNPFLTQFLTLKKQTSLPLLKKILVYLVHAQGNDPN